MKSSDTLIENTDSFRILILSKNTEAQKILFAAARPRLQKFQNVETIRSFSELLRIFSSNRDKKLIVFVDVATPFLEELEETIYRTHAEANGAIFGFTTSQISDQAFDDLISAGFDDVFEFGNRDNKTYVRMYSWIRRFGRNPIAAKDAIAQLPQKYGRIGGHKLQRIGRWSVSKQEMIAIDDDERKVKLTKQEVDFLTLLNYLESDIADTSYSKLFKAPHAIANSLKKKLGEDLPIQHRGGGRYRLIE